MRWLQVYWMYGMIPIIPYMIKEATMSILEDIKAIVPQYHGDCHDIITTRFHDDPMQLDVLHALSRLAGQFDDTGKRPPCHQ